MNSRRRNGRNRIPLSGNGGSLACGQAANNRADCSRELPCAALCECCRNRAAVPKPQTHKTRSWWALLLRASTPRQATAGGKEAMDVAGFWQGRCHSGMRHVRDGGKTPALLALYPNAPGLAAMQLAFTTYCGGASLGSILRLFGLFWPGKFMGINCRSQDGFR